MEKKLARNAPRKGTSDAASNGPTFSVSPLLSPISLAIADGHYRESPGSAADGGAPPGGGSFLTTW